MFVINDKVVYPGHGVAFIAHIITQDIAGSLTRCYELKFLNKDMKILVPVHNALAIGIRPLSTQQYVSDALKILAEPARRLSKYEFTASSWTRRYKKCLDEMRTGDIKKISEIYRDLTFIQTQKELSFGEKNLLLQTENLLVEEISLVRQLPQDKAIEQLRSLCLFKAKSLKIKQL